MLRKIALLIAVVAAAAVVAPVTASAAPTACTVDWGSGAKSAWPMTAGQLTNIRAGRQDCYDRLVFDVVGTNDGYHVQYVTEVHHEGSGHLVPLRGDGKLQITVHSPAYDHDGNPTYRYANPAELVDVTGYQTFRQVAWAGSFEGQTTVGLGVRARLPFRVFTLPGRVVVDVAHTW
ncbi:AMIN-like domain-containing (lipo)protein [Saccharothrix hoggarensis]|uniref:AMIN-like domain-containing protein n=1 Tax=Saccharothrix hoggarensis TaxID=913853 RepID=A0ABW3QRP2_9PSEU